MRRWSFADCKVHLMRSVLSVGVRLSSALERPQKRGDLDCSKGQNVSGTAQGNDEPGALAHRSQV